MSTTKKKRFEGLEKRSLSEFNLAEIRGWAIDRLIQIEYRIDYIILEFFNPEQKNHFTEILLNSSVIDLGGKAKVLRNIGVPKSTIERIRKMVSIRNGFAHAPFSEEVSVILKRNENDLEDVNLEAWSTISVMNSEGLIKNKVASELLLEFFDLNKELRIELDEFLKSLKGTKT